MRSILPSLILVVIIAVFSCIHYKQVETIYTLLGGSVGIGADWVHQHTIAISNVGHLLAYFLLLISLHIFSRIGLLKSGVVVLLLAVGGEAVQVLLPSRQGDLGDLAYDLTGIVLACVIIFVAKSRKMAR